MLLSEIAKELKGTLHGKDIDIYKIGSLDSNCENAILYASNNKNLQDALKKNPAALIVSKEIKGNIPYIVVDDVKIAFIALLKIFAPVTKNYQGIHPDAYVDREAAIGKNVNIMPGAVIMPGVFIDEGSTIYPACVLESDVKIGKNSVLYSGVIIRERCSLGSDCIIHAGTVIGSDGYGFYEKNGTILKIPQNGNVIIGDRVEIGANCCVDRATVGSTVISNDTKLDNLVHIAHNVTIGERCYIVAQAGISGSVTIGNHVTIAGQVGIVDHVSIVDDTVIMAQSGITGNIKKPDLVFGTPARPVKEHHKIHAAMKHLPELLKRVKKLEKHIYDSKDNS